MNKRLPKIYHEDIKKDVNKKTYYSYAEEGVKTPSVNIASNKYEDNNYYDLMNKIVDITLMNNGIVTGKIVGKVADHLILDNSEIVMLNQIKNIQIKSR